MNEDPRNAQYLNDPAVSAEALLREYQVKCRRINEKYDEIRVEETFRDAILAELKRRKAHV